MSGTFPLYDNLYRESTSTELTKQERDEFIKIVKKIDTYGSELIYAVAKCYQLNHVSSTDILNLPYKSKLVKGAIRFELEEMPPKLQRMLYIFLKKHMQKMQEEFERNKEALISH
jgi:hypothetical protein